MPMLTEAAEILATRTVRTPLGTAEVTASRDGLRSCKLTACDVATRTGDRRAEQHLDVAERELEAYFAGALRSFDTLLDPTGTPFQRGVWAALCRIPFGQTRSYAQLAEMVGNPAAVRAVGRANGANPLWIIVPCHRVIGSDGSLTGYAGGIETKRRLLSHEGVALPGDAPLFAGA